MFLSLKKICIEVALNLKEIFCKTIAFLNTFQVRFKPDKVKGRNSMSFLETYK